MLVRATSLGLRFLLAIYLARYLGLYATGVYGILTGVSGIVPAVLGFGVSYFVNRDVVELPRDRAYLLIRDRTLFNMVVAALAWLLGLGLLAIFQPKLPDHFAIMALIVTLEFLCFDLHVALINVGRPVLSNFLLFIRSASWIPLFIALGIHDADDRTLAMLLYCWLGALLINIPLHFVVLHDVDFDVLRRARVAWRPLLEHASRAPPFYINDLAATGQIYLDRFIVLNVMGVTATGLYTLNWQLTHGVYIVTATATIQMALPKLIDARQRTGMTGWRDVMIAEGSRATALAAALSVVASLVALVALPLMGFGGFATDVPFFLLMVATTLIKPLGDLTNAGLYSLRFDRRLVAINLGGIVGSAILGVTATYFLGLIGIGLAAFASQAIVIAIRLQQFSQEGSRS